VSDHFFLMELTQQARSHL